MGQELFSARLGRVGEQTRDLATALHAVTTVSSEPPGYKDMRWWWGGGAASVDLIGQEDKKTFTGCTKHLKVTGPSPPPLTVHTPTQGRPHTLQTARINPKNSRQCRKKKNKPLLAAQPSVKQDPLQTVSRHSSRSDRGPDVK